MPIESLHEQRIHTTINQRYPEGAWMNVDSTKSMLANSDLSVVNAEANIHWVVSADSNELLRVGEGVAEYLFQMSVFTQPVAVAIPTLALGDEDLVDASLTKTGKGSCGGLPTSFHEIWMGGVRCAGREVHDVNSEGCWCGLRPRMSR